MDRDFFRKYLDILSESSPPQVLAESIELHDSFDIELNENFVIETGIIGLFSDNTSNTFGGSAMYYNTSSNLSSATIGGTSVIFASTYIDGVKLDSNKVVLVKSQNSAFYY